MEQEIRNAKHTLFWTAYLRSQADRGAALRCIDGGSARGKDAKGVNLWVGVTVGLREEGAGR